MDAFRVEDIGMAHEFLNVGQRRSLGQMIRAKRMTTIEQVPIPFVESFAFEFVDRNGEFLTSERLAVIGFENVARFAFPFRQKTSQVLLA